MGTKKTSPLLSVREYAKRCGVSKTVILKRIENGEIEKENHEGAFFIDSKKFPPKGPGKPGRRFVSMLI